MLHPECYPHPQIILEFLKKNFSVDYVGDIFWKFTIFSNFQKVPSNWWILVPFRMLRLCCFPNSPLKRARFKLRRNKLPRFPMWFVGENGQPGWIKWIRMFTNKNLYPKVSHHLKKWSLLKAYTFKWVVHHQLKNGESKFQGLYRTHHNRSVSTWVANLKETQSDLNT